MIITGLKTETYRYHYFHAAFHFTAQTEEMVKAEAAGASRTTEASGAA
jgi:hypothetical protein